MIYQIKEYAEKRKISEFKAWQVFCQVLVLKNLSFEKARFMGGTALVFGNGNPRFSEDIDLTQVEDPLQLKTDLMRSVRDIRESLNVSASLKIPVAGKRTYRITCNVNQAQAIRLHIDSQEYPAYTHRPMVIEFPSLTPFVVSAIELNEILADKVMAISGRRYVNGRDLFDIWFHWLRQSQAENSRETINKLVQKKRSDRKISMSIFQNGLRRLTRISVFRERIEEEWRRYLPPDFQSKILGMEILEKCQNLPSFFEGL
jgi:predicted nucleotidyltransferase component of viral defense system